MVEQRIDEQDATEFIKGDYLWQKSPIGENQDCY